MSDLSNVCQGIYELSGQDAVMGYVLKYHEHIPWLMCDGCEVESPVKDGSCLVCGLTVGG